MEQAPIPVKRRGRKSQEQRDQADDQDRVFAEWLQSRADEIGYKVSSRGWCYILEEHGLTKGKFDGMQKMINDFRKDGLLPVDFCKSDDSRTVEFGDIGFKNTEDPEEYAISMIQEQREYLEGVHHSYNPHSMWEFQDTYLELFVEKIDLITLFAGTCKKYGITATNCKGWTDINRRFEALLRFNNYADTHSLVLLVCGDHDPGGLNITNTLPNNLQDLEECYDTEGEEVPWGLAGQINVVRFGLNYDFIQEHNLSWIDNLATSNKKTGAKPLDHPKHPDHDKPYVQSYLKKFGVRKVEANALITRPKAAKQLISEAVEKYLDPEGLDKYRQAVDDSQEEAREAIERLRDTDLDEYE